MSRNDRTHGAGILTRMIALANLFIALLGGLVAFWLLVSFPLWWSGAPRIPLPVDIAIGPESEILTLVDPTPFQEHELGRVTGELEVKFDSAWAQWLYLFFGLQEIFLVFLVLHFLHKIVGSIAHGEAFSSANAKRLRWVGLLLIIESIYGPGISKLVSGVVTSGLETSGAIISVNWISEFGKGGFFSGWIVIILSEVFRRGAELEQDQSLTV